MTANNNENDTTCTSPTWMGAISFKEMMDPSQQSMMDVENDHQAVFGLFVLYGSWNYPLSSNIDTVRVFLENLLSCLEGKDEHRLCGCVQVDSSEESLSDCIGDNGTNNKVIFPIPPGELPVLAIVINQQWMNQPYLHYVSSNSILSSTNLMRNCLGMSLFDIKQKKKQQQQQQQLLIHELQSFVPVKHQITSNNELHNQAVRIFVAGDRMSVGKTSVCLGLLGTLIARGYPPEKLAYIKPATQNESPQLVQKYCEQVGIPCVPIGPIVYYRGFTRAFLAGETESSEELLARVEIEVDKLCQNKLVVIVDGVGFPAVGSICGTDNASVAIASGYSIGGSNNNNSGNRQPPGVVLVGGSGVGGAVDAFNLNATYFESKNVPVLGSIFNKLCLDGFYSLENCKAQITSYFDQNAHQRRHNRQAFGFVPLMSFLGGSNALDRVNEYIDVFSSHVNVRGIVMAALKVQQQGQQANGEVVVADITPKESTKRKLQSQGGKEKVLSRTEIEQRAIQAGAAPSA